jgi:hypothetical protein
MSVNAHAMRAYFFFLVEAFFFDDAFFFEDLLTRLVVTQRNTNLLPTCFIVHFGAAAEAGDATPPTDSERAITTEPKAALDLRETFIMNFPSKPTQ